MLCCPKLPTPKNQSISFQFSLRQALKRGGGGAGAGGGGGAGMGEAARFLDNISQEQSPYELLILSYAETA